MNPASFGFPQAVCFKQVACEKSASATDKFAVKITLAVSSTEFCQTLFDESQIRIRHLLENTYPLTGGLPLYIIATIIIVTIIYF